MNMTNKFLLFIFAFVLTLTQKVSSAANIDCALMKNALNAQVPTLAPSNAPTISPPIGFPPPVCGRDPPELPGEEPPEYLFMKELRKRGMTSASLLEEKKQSSDRSEEVKYREEDGGWNYSITNGFRTDAELNLTNQRERSMALNSECLEGLIPRAKLLLTLGATFFLAFWPLILVTVVSFSACYLYFGPKFVHDGTDVSVSIPPYVDPYALLEEQKMYKKAPLIK